MLIEATVIALTKLQPLLNKVLNYSILLKCVCELESVCDLFNCVGVVQDSPMHKALFWVAVAVLQLDEVNLYSAGTALLEQNLHTLDSLRVFNDKVLI